MSLLSSKLLLNIFGLVWETDTPVGCHRACPVCTGDQLLLSLQDAAYTSESTIYLEVA